MELVLQMLLVGFNLGVGTIKKSIPPKAIFLPNHKFKSNDQVSLVSLDLQLSHPKI